MAVYDRLTAFCRSRWVYLLFFLLPLFIYYPLFRSGMVLQGGTDLLFGHYPGLLYGHHMLRAGDLGLWNRLIYDGRDFSQSLLNHIYYPLNWPTLLVPDRFVLRFISWQLFFEICACGCLAYAIAGIYLTDPWSRLLVAVTTELGGFMWFNVTTFIGVHLTFVTLISVYFLLTPERRRYLATFVALSFGFAGVMLIGHPGYLCGFGLVLIGVFVAKLFALPPGRDQRIYGAAIIAAGVAAVVLSAFRTMPVFTQLSHEGGGGGWAADYHDSLYYLFSGLIPGAFGLDVSEASAILTIFGGPDRNNQFHTMHYFGVAAFFLGYAGVFGQAGRRTLIMALVTLLLVVTSVGMKPLSDFFYLTIWPITHESMTKYPCYFSILALMVFTLHALETGRLQLSERNIRGFLLIVAGVLALIITYVANLAFFMGLTHWVYFVVALKLLLLCAFALGIGVAWRPKMSSAVFGRATALSLAVFAAIGAGTAYYCSHHHAFLHEWMVLQTFRNYTGTVACAVAVVYAARLLGGRQPAATRDRIIVAVATGVAIVLLLVSVKDGYLTRDGVASTLFTAIWSTGVFFVLSCTVAELFARSVDRRLLTFLLAILTIGDLLFFDRVYEHVNGPPFVALSQMYPDAQGFDPDYDRARWEKAGDQAELLARPDLVVTGNAVVGWSRGGAANAVEAVDGRAETVRIVNRGDDLASVFQDLRPPRAATSVSFGVWVRGDASARPEILLSGAARGGGPLPYDGKGRWQWLSWTIDRPAEKWGTVRPTLGVLGPGSAEFYAPHLVAGPYIKPRASPSGDIAASASLAAAERYRGDDVMDLKQYRINNPSYLVGWPSVLSDIPMIYGLPTYGGEDFRPPGRLREVPGSFRSGSARPALVPAGRCRDRDPERAAARSPRRAIRRAADLYPALEQRHHPAAQCAGTALAVPAFRSDRRPGRGHRPPERSRLRSDHDRHPRPRSGLDRWRCRALHPHALRRGEIGSARSLLRRSSANRAAVRRYLFSRMACQGRRRGAADLSRQRPFHGGQPAAGQAPADALLRAAAILLACRDRRRRDGRAPVAGGLSRRYHGSLGAPALSGRCRTRPTRHDPEREEPMTTHSERYFDQAAEVARRIDRAMVERIVEGLLALREAGGRLFLLGVGGSAGNCSHAVNDFRKLCGIEAYSPCDNVSELTARTNDEGWETVFAAWLRSSGQCQGCGIGVLGRRRRRGKEGQPQHRRWLCRKPSSAASGFYGIVGRDGGYTKQLAMTWWWCRQSTRR